LATASKVQYRNPPIIESVFEIFFSANVPWSESLKNSLLKAVPSKFLSKVENLSFHSIECSCWTTDYSKVFSAYAESPLLDRIKRSNVTIWTGYGRNKCVSSLLDN
jgi:hypothetical protein